MALEEFLINHQLDGKRGPTAKHIPADYIKIKEESKIKPKGRTPNSGNVQEAEDEFTK